MNEQKYCVGEFVRIRPFYEIDVNDIGNGTYGYDTFRRECLNLPEQTINDYSCDYAVLIVRDCKYSGTIEGYIYHLQTPEGDPIPYAWSQGMLAPFDEDELMDPDEEGLFAFLSV